MKDLFTVKSSDCSVLLSSLLPKFSCFLPSFYLGYKLLRHIVGWEGIYVSTVASCSYDLDSDPMTLIYKPDLKILNVHVRISKQLNFPGQGFRKFEHYRQTNATEILTHQALFKSLASAVNKISFRFNSRVHEPHLMDPEFSCLGLLARNICASYVLTLDARRPAVQMHN